MSSESEDEVLPGKPKVDPFVLEEQLQTYLSGRAPIDPSWNYITGKTWYWPLPSWPQIIQQGSKLRISSLLLRGRSIVHHPHSSETIHNLLCRQYATVERKENSLRAALRKVRRHMQTTSGPSWLRQGPGNSITHQRWKTLLHKPTWLQDARKQLVVIVAAIRDLQRISSMSKIGAGPKSWVYEEWATCSFTLEMN